MPKPDALAVLDAIEEAFRVQVTLLFKNLCDGLGDAADDQFKEYWKSPIDRFNAGLDIARNARRMAREQFAGKED